MNTKAKWIWHKDDYEIYHSLLLHSRRTEYGIGYACMWKTDAPYKTVQFCKEYSTNEEVEITVYSNAIGRVTVEGKGYEIGKPFVLPVGEHKIVVRVTKPDGLPCVFVDSEFCPSDETWQVSHMTAEYFPVGCTPAYYDVDITPETFLFEYDRKEPISIEKKEEGIFYDFGKEMFGKVIVSNAACPLEIYCGESVEEALDLENTIVSEKVAGQSEYTLSSRAFRYIYVRYATEELKVVADYEYLPLNYKGNFSCKDDLISKIWEVSAYTFHLNSREFFLDGIKRDRWVWSGDAYQSYMINNYLFFNKEITRRTIIALRGKDPVEQHINTILDYSFYWIISIYDYYFTYSDLSLAESMYEKMKSLMDFCMSRVDSNGFVEGKEGDWVFVDWSEMDKEGAICAEQMLYCKALDVMAEISKLLDKPSELYEETSVEIKEKMDEHFWCEEKGAYIDSYVSGKKNVTRHANIFAIMFDLVAGDRKKVILENVLKNESVTQITTPYFKFFELDAMCRMGELDSTTELINNYWGGMIKLGATSIWETYDPTESGVEHYGMYGNKYGKSLCHAWGGGPIYLLGRYYMGVYPTSLGYGTFNVEPKLGGLENIEGTVPLKNGEVKIYMDKDILKVTATKEGGTLIFNDKEYVLEKDKELII